MSGTTAKKVRCLTQTEQAPNKPTRMKCFSNHPFTETLRTQTKFINPYSQIGCKSQAKTALNLQKPHSIVLISKRHQKAASEMKISPFIDTAEHQTQQKYKLEKIIGKGLYSIIYRGYLSQTNRRIAIKKQPQDPRLKNKQVAILKKFNHCNILGIIDHYYTLQKGRRFLCIVTELHDCDLFHYIRQKKRRVSEDAIKNFAYQILKGVQELHRCCIVHRDLKSSNIFINKKQDRAIIGDLGSAREVSLGETVSGEPCPFSYRAPQLLFGLNNYSYASDIWAFGCILLEMVNLCLPFKSRNNTEHLLQVINLLGTPSLQEISEMNENYDEKQYQMLPKVKGKNVKDAFHLDNTLSNLLRQIFVYSPLKRITASEALRHQYFIDIKSQQSSIFKLSNRSLLIATPSNKKIQQTLNTIATFQDESPQQIRQELQFQNKQILLRREGINIPLKINRKLQF